MAPLKKNPCKTMVRKSKRRKLDRIVIDFSVAPSALWLISGLYRRHSELRSSYLPGNYRPIRDSFLEFKNLRILEPQKWQLKSTDNWQLSTVRVYAVAELVEAPRVVPSTGSGTVHKVCCPLTVVCWPCKPKANNIKTTSILIVAKIWKGKRQMTKG